MQYKDEEGDDCTLVEATIRDAVAVASKSGTLRLVFVGGRANPESLASVLGENVDVVSTFLKKALSSLKGP